MESCSFGSDDSDGYSGYQRSSRLAARKQPSPASAAGFGQPMQKIIRTCTQFFPNKHKNNGDGEGVLQQTLKGKSKRMIMQDARLKKQQARAKAMPSSSQLLPMNRKLTCEEVIFMTRMYTLK